MRSLRIHTTLTVLAMIAVLAVGFWTRSAAAPADNATVPGALTTPYPTIENLAVEWEIQGDDNLNGVVTVEYRRTGERNWHAAMPLRRVPAGRSQGTRPIFEWKNKHSGSIFDLRPDTEYEIRLRLADPDGGAAEKTVRVRTRPVPGDAGARIIDLPAGQHEDLQTENGTAEHPVIYRSKDGKAVYTHVDLRDRKWVYLDGLQIVNKQPRGVGIDLRGAENCVVRRCRIEAVEGIDGGRPGARNCYIADNVVHGINHWISEAMGADGKNLGEGIEVTGPGNVICYNHVSAFRDCISTWEDQGAVDQICIDIYNNDIDVGCDDAIEADFCFNNCRIMRNRITNSFVGLSSQPGLGGPTYFIRNVMYNLTYVPFKLHRTSIGDVALHNTVVKIGDGMVCFSGAPFDHAFFRNNLCIGGKAAQYTWGHYAGGTGRAVNMVAPGPHSSFDYDAVGSEGGEAGGRIGQQPFAQAEPHGKIVEFASLFSGVVFPEPPVPERQPADLRPRAGAPVIDAAVRLPNINDNFRGRAPDIGAYEAGQPLPQYGPRR